MNPPRLVFHMEIPTTYSRRLLCAPSSPRPWQIEYCLTMVFQLQVVLSCCRKITDDAIVTLAKACRRLHSLYIDSCVELTDRSIMSFNNLREVNISWCRKITQEGIGEFNPPERLREHIAGILAGVKSKMSSAPQRSDVTLISFCSISRNVRKRTPSSPFGQGLRRRYERSNVATRELVAEARSS